MIAALRGIQVDISVVPDADDAFNSSKATAPSGNTFGVAGIPFSFSSRIFVDPELVTRDRDKCVESITVCYKLTSQFADDLKQSIATHRFISDDFKALFGRFKATYPTLAAELEAWINAAEDKTNREATVNTYFSEGKFAYKMTDEEIGRTVELSRVGTIHLNSDNLGDIKKYADAFTTSTAMPKPGREQILDNLLSKNGEESTIKELIQKQYTRVLAHEGNHIFYALNNKIIAFKWSFVGNPDITDCYPAKPGTTDCKYCSMAHGHEKNNPDGQQACYEQCKYDKPTYHER
jgi:hypothetical protein